MKTVVEKAVATAVHMVAIMTMTKMMICNEKMLMASFFTILIR